MGPELDESVFAGYHNVQSQRLKLSADKIRKNAE